jgi:hypothetical protein
VKSGIMMLLDINTNQGQIRISIMFEDTVK